MNENIIISIASDHAGYDMKDKVVNFLKAKNIEVIDRGPCLLYTSDAADE